MSLAKKTTQGRIEVEVYDTQEEANARAEELGREDDPDMGILVYRCQHYDWMDDVTVYYAVRWIKPIGSVAQKELDKVIEKLVPHG